jgi:hypothetical protein
MQVEVLFTEGVTNPQEAIDSGVIGAPDVSSSLADLSSSLASGLASDAFRSAHRRRGAGQPKSLLSEQLRNGDGAGPVAALEEYSGKLLVITLEITDVVERTGLTLSVWGSENQSDWGAQPLLKFRQRQYCGVYSALLNMAAHPEVRYLRVEWSTSRWGKTARVPAFGFKVFVEESGARVSHSALA